MPEGPSVLAAASRLHTRLEGATILSAAVVGGRYKTHGNPKGFDVFQIQLPLVIEGIGCKGKLIWWKLGGGALYMLSTLGLSGAWRFRKDKHSAVVLVTSRGSVWFSDQLHYGTMSFVDRATFRKKIRTIGPDLLRSPPPSLARIDRQFDKCSAWPISKFLMDQSKVSGIGNYLKAEILYVSRIAPETTIGSLDVAARKRLYLCMVLMPRIDLLKRRLVVDGEPHMYPWRFVMRVYRKKTVLGGYAVERSKTSDKRVTYWVPAVQK